MDVDEWKKKAICKKMIEELEEKRNDKKIMKSPRRKQTE